MEALTNKAVDSLRQTDKAIALGVSVLAVAAMSVDHLMGDDPGLEDPPMFVISCVATLGLVALVFGRIVPRAKAADRAARDGLILSVVAIVPGIATLWVGLPFALAGGGLALGLYAWQRSRDRRAAAAIVAAALMLGFATIAHVVQAVDKLA
jgi:hypothetical protein